MAWPRKARSETPHPIGPEEPDLTGLMEAAEQAFKDQRLEELERAQASLRNEDPLFQWHRPECTLYFNQIGRLMTAWRFRWPDGHLEVRYESGLRAYPSDYATPLDEGVSLVAD